MHRWEGKRVGECIYGRDASMKERIEKDERTKKGREDLE